MKGPKNIQEVGSVKKRKKLVKQEILKKWIIVFLGNISNMLYILFRKIFNGILILFEFLYGFIIFWWICLNEVPQIFSDEIIQIFSWIFKSFYLFLNFIFIYCNFRPVRTKMEIQVMVLRRKQILRTKFFFVQICLRKLRIKCYHFFLIR